MHIGMAAFFILAQLTPCKKRKNMFCRTPATCLPASSLGGFMLKIPAIRFCVLLLSFLVLGLLFTVPTLATQVSTPVVFSLFLCPPTNSIACQFTATGAGTVTFGDYPVIANGGAIFTNGDTMSFTAISRFVGGPPFGNVTLDLSGVEYQGQFLEDTVADGFESTPGGILEFVYGDFYLDGANGHPALFGDLAVGPTSSGSGYDGNLIVAPVPEPSTLALAAFGLLGLLIIYRLPKRRLASSIRCCELPEP